VNNLPIDGDTEVSEQYFKGEKAVVTFNPNAPSSQLYITCMSLMGLRSRKYMHDHFLNGFCIVVEQNCTAVIKSEEA